MIPSDLLAPHDTPYEADVAYGADVAVGPPPVSPTTLAVYDWVGPGMRADDGDRGWPYLAIISSLCEPLWEVEKVVRARDGRVGWAAAFDPDTVPPDALSWFEMTVGLDAAPALPEDRRRERTKASPAFSRGGEEALKAAARLTLEGSRLVHLMVRTGSTDQDVDRPYHHLVQTFRAQTPEPARTAAALEAAKPGPDIVEYRVIDGATYGQLAAEFPTVGDFEAEWGSQTNGDVATHLPPEELL